MEFGNYCSNNCSFCGMANDNIGLNRYKMTFKEQITGIDLVCELGIKHLHMVAGESYEYNIEELCEAVKYAASNGLVITIVIGELTVQDYERLYTAGARKYLLKFETSNSDLYTRYKSGKALKNRIAHLLLLRDIGYKIGTGVIVGLPETTQEDIISDLALLKLLEPEMTSASIFIPNQSSALKECKQGDPDDTLKFIALMRLLFKKTQFISCSSALGTKWQEQALLAGANLISFHITPNEYIDGFVSYRQDRYKTTMDHIRELALNTKMKIDI